MANAERWYLATFVTAALLGPVGWAALLVLGQQAVGHGTAHVAKADEADDGTISQAQPLGKCGIAVDRLATLELSRVTSTAYSPSGSSICTRRR